MTLIQFKIFKTIVETGSFTKTGKILGLTQSGVSHSIASLEKELGITVFQRNKSGVTLTTEGQQLLDHIDTIISHTRLIKEKASSLSNLKTGNVRIGTFPAFAAGILPPIISHFRKQHPGISIELLEGRCNKIYNWINSYEIDVGFFDLGYPEIGPNELESIPLLRDNVIVIFPEDHHLQNREEIDIKEILAEKLILPSGGCSYLVKNIIANKNVEIVFEIEDHNIIYSMVEQGLALAIIPELTFINKSFKVGKAILKPAKFRDIGMAVKYFNYSSNATLTFIN
ncbi:MAG: LysR family transcriptional regulator, partial [Halanaerobiales bacterium]